MNKEQNLETTPTNHLSQPETGDETSEGKDPEQTLTAAQCAELAGVSVDTIEKYVAIGLLQPTRDASGESRYRQSDIRSLFYTRKSLQPKLDEELPNILDLAGEDESDQDSDSSLTSEKQNAPSEDDSAVDPTISQSAAQTESDTSSQGSIDHHNASSKAESDAKLNADQETTSEDAEQPLTETSAVESSRETSQSREVEHAQEVQYALREQIEVLKEERDWLRNRVEQLELRGEREQMLLLSESETIRRLVSQKTFTEKVLQTFRLPWLQQERK